MRKYKEIVSKQISETISWLTLLYELDEISENEYNDMLDEAVQIMKILSKSISTLKKHLE